MISNYLHPVALIVIVSILGTSCENKIPVIPKSDLLTLPSITGKEINTVVTDSGKIQLKMYAPVVDQFEKSDPPYYEFISGLKVIVYNGLDTPQVTITSKYAKCTNSNLWELRDSVLVINEKGEKLETELLFWNQEKDLIYTDRFVKILSEDQITQGIGFESDSHLTRRKIMKVTAEIAISDEE